MLVAAAVAVLTGVAALASDPPESGLKPGEKIVEFQMVDVTGPFHGKQIEAGVHLSHKNVPVVMVLVNDDPRNVAGLVTGIEQMVLARRDRGVDGFIAFLAGPEAIARIRKLAAEQNTRISLGVLPGGRTQKDLAHYRLNPAARNTVIVYRGKTVHARFVDIDGGKVPRVAAAVDRLLERRQE